MTEETNELLKQMLSEMRIQNLDKRLWSMDDIATYIGLSKGSVRQRIICKVGFPKSIKVTSGHPRWNPAEVRDWVNKHREKSA